MTTSAPTPSFGVVPLETMASMTGLDFVRAIFSGKIPQAPIMEQVRPYDCEANEGSVILHSVPSLQFYNPIGSVHGGYSGILLDSAMGLAVHTMLPKGSGYTTLEYKVSLVRGMSDSTGPVRTEGRVISSGRRVATAEGRILDSQGRVLSHGTTTCLIFELPKAS